MVRLFIKEEYMSLQDRMIVKNESGQDIYLIVGKWGRVGDSLSLYTLTGERLVEARQKKLSVFPKFDLFVEEEKIASVKKHPGFGGVKDPYFTVSKLDWLVTGDFIEQRYSVRHNGALVMNLNKNHSILGNVYSLQIEREEIAPICCILSVIIDHYSPNKDTAWEEYKQRQYHLGFMHPILLKTNKAASEKK